MNKLTSHTHHIIIIHTYLYHMHIKNYSTYPENLEVKAISDERLENLIDDR